MSELDTTIVDLHRAKRHAMQILDVVGQAWRVVEPSAAGAPLQTGDGLTVGETIFLAAGATVTLADGVLEGGRRGRAHSFVPEDAFKSSPSLDDVPRLVAQLEQLERQVEARASEDPLAEQRGPKTVFDRALSREFAVLNLDSRAAHTLPEDVARKEGAVCLFFHGDAACVALTEMSVRRIRTLMAALGRPVNPHLVDDETLQLCLGMVYQRSRSPC